MLRFLWAILKYLLGYQFCKCKLFKANSSYNLKFNVQKFTGRTCVTETGDNKNSDLLAALWEK